MNGKVVSGQKDLAPYLVYLVKGIGIIVQVFCLN